MSSDVSTLLFKDNPIEHIENIPDLFDVNKMKQQLLCSLLLAHHIFHFKFSDMIIACHTTSYVQSSNFMFMR